MEKQRAWYAAVVMLVAAMVLPLSADARMPMTSEEVAAACNLEMAVIFKDTYAQMNTVASDLIMQIIDLPVDTSVPQVFKLTTTASAKIDKIAASGTLKLEKVGTKCIAKLIRMNADTFLQGEVAETRAMGVELVAFYQNLAQGDMVSSMVNFID